MLHKAQTSNDKVILVSLTLYINTYEFYSYIFLKFYKVLKWQIWKCELGWFSLGESHSCNMCTYELPDMDVTPSLELLKEITHAHVTTHTYVYNTTYRFVANTTHTSDVISLINN